MKLSELQKKTRNIEVEYQGETVAITYLVNVVTPGFLSDEPDLVEQVKRAVVEWDVLNDDGEKLPPKEVAGEMPLAFLKLVLEAVIDDMRVETGQKKG
jgi:hypothetical protein